MPINALKLTLKVIYHWKRQPYFFLANLFLKQGISSDMSWLISFAWANSGCKERKPIITKWKILAHSRTRTHDPWFSRLVPYPLRHQGWYTNDYLKLIQCNTGFYCAIYSYIVPCETVFLFCHVFHNVIIWYGCHFAVWSIDIGQTAKWHQFHITTILNTWQNELTTLNWKYNFSCQL